MDNQNNGWDEISEQNKKSIKNNKKKENRDKGFNASMAILTLIPLAVLLFLYIIIKLG